MMDIAAGWVVSTCQESSSAAAQTGAVTGSWSKVLFCSVFVAVAHACSSVCGCCRRQGRSSARRCDAASVLYDESTPVEESNDEKGPCTNMNLMCYGFTLLIVCLSPYSGT